MSLQFESFAVRDARTTYGEGHFVVAITYKRLRNPVVQRVVVRKFIETAIREKIERDRQQPQETRQP